MNCFFWWHKITVTWHFCLFISFGHRGFVWGILKGIFVYSEAMPQVLRPSCDPNLWFLLGQYAAKFCWLLRPGNVASISSRRPKHVLKVTRLTSLVFWVLSIHWRQIWWRVLILIQWEFVSSLYQPWRRFTRIAKAFLYTTQQALIWSVAYDTLARIETHLF